MTVLTAFCDATTSTNGHTCRCRQLPHAGGHHCRCGAVWDGVADAQPNELDRLRAEVSGLRVERGNALAAAADAGEAVHRLAVENRAAMEELDRLRAENDCTTAAFAAAAGYYSCPCGSTFEFFTDSTLEDWGGLNRWLGRHDGSHPQCDINREGTC